ncbi:hypothetical protein I5S62_18330 [Pseudomonas putida]|uniref:hypothetical protein n=1 Tax=Pseudomonas putida TaxID=303 RepID=UPI0018DA2C4D|nr:hypothetical protein [Pseudomonas putida]MBH3391065.1 hypothetical protein [Pseudomonas putida]
MDTRKKNKSDKRFEILGEWPGIKNKIIKDLVGVVFDIVEGLFGRSLPHPVHVINFPLANNPIACYVMKDGCYQVHLSASSGGFWSQIVYQLAHELCHLNSNYSSSIGHKHKWFEEALCEMCSIAVLDKLSKFWNSSTMHGYNKKYAASLKNYLESLPSMTGYLPENRNAYDAWLVANIDRLEGCSEIRELNGVVAAYLYKNLFRDQPTAWACVGMLNKWNCHHDSSFLEFKNSWRKSCADSIEIKNVLSFL